MKTHIGEYNHFVLQALDQGLKGRIVHIGGIAGSRHDQAPLIQDHRYLATYNPAVV